MNKVLHLREAALGAAVQRSPTCLQVGDHSAAGQRPFGSVQSHRVAGARTQVGQLVLLLVAFHQECVSCHLKEKNEEKIKQLQTNKLKYKRNMSYKHAH